MARLVKKIIGLGDPYEADLQESSYLQGSYHVVSLGKYDPVWKIYVGSTIRDYIYELAVVQVK